MKNLKRLIALVAVFALALTTIASAATFTDVAEDSAYYEAVETLTKLGIIDGYTDGTFKPEQTVTRAEMAKLIATMQGLGVSADGGATTEFTDVPASHWASGYIANATGNAINGYPDKTFRPDENVKYEQAVKMIMATLGYTVIANGNGGYPMGFVSAAIKEKVTANVSNANVGTDANRGTIAQLIYNAIDTPLVEQTTWEADGSGEYKKYDGVTTKPYKSLMSENLDVVKMKGVVTASAYTAIADTDIVFDKDEDAKVDIAVTYDYKADSEFTENIDEDVPSQTSTFLVGDTDVENYVGMAVIFFAMEDDYDNWVIISVAEDTTYNKTVEFDIANYDPEKTDDETNVLYYFKDGASKSTKLALESTIAVVWNNVPLETATLAGLMDLLGDEDDTDSLFGAKMSGSITLIDNDKTTGYNVVVVETAAVAVVDSVEDGVIMIKDASDFYLAGDIDTDDDATVVVILKDGKEITAEELNENDVLSVIYNEDGVYTVIEVMSEPIEGTVSSKKNSDTSATGSAYKIDGSWYDVAAGCSLSVKAGDAGVFYVDKYGKIAYYEKSKTVSGNYAYVVAELISEDGIDGKTYEIKLLTKDGVKTYEVADKFKVDDTSYNVKDLEVNGEFGLDKQLVDVTFSGEYIKNIVTAGHDEEDSLSKPAKISGLYDAEDIEIGGEPIDKDAIVFFVEENDKGSFKSSESYVGTLADLTDSDSIEAGKGFAYTTSDSDEDPTVLVLVNATAAVNAASNLAVIVDIEDSTNDDEEDIFAITALYNGREVELTTSADVATENEDLAIGDVVKVRVNANNVITAMALVTDDIAIDRRGGAAVDATIEKVAGTNETIVAGYAEAIAKGTKKITVDGVEYKLGKFANIYVVDYTSRDIKITNGSSSSYKFEERFFDAAYAGKTLSLDGESLGTVKDAADMVADYVIIRAYEGSDDVFEAVIVKGDSDYKIK